MKRLREVTLTLGLWLSAGGAGFAQVPVLASRPGQTLTFSVGDSTRVADVTREGFSADGVVVQRAPGRLRGEVGVEPLNVELEPQRVAGTLGDHRVSLDVLRARDGLQIVGSFGARSIAIEVRPSGIHGQVGPCWYSLTRAGADYRGNVSCGGPAEMVDLKVPVSFVARDDRELAAMLTALLAR
ncbi:MAG TPA: hypothetical protein VHO06_25915 [Polyangia bacterium]|nr:hypothetical protein [Polyangia bacterium]